ncbi:MAG: NUDIX domain-containing protein [Acetobacteraceae bacterium]|nr:NUDIX domain-containing protein [Acetobacteraceae bacterium]
MQARQFPPIPSGPDVEILSEDRVYAGRFALDVVRFRHRRFDGAMSGVRTWEVFRRGEAAALLPYDPDADAVVLMEQFRLPALAAGMDPVMLEIPAGLCDPGETAEETIIRETQEEIGLQVGALERVGDFVLTPGGADERVRIFVGRVQAPDGGAAGVAGSGGLASEHEDIRVRVMPAKEAVARALGGHLPNSVTALSLLWLAAHRDHLRTKWRG